MARKRKATRRRSRRRAMTAAQRKYFAPRRRRSARRVTRRVSAGSSAPMARCRRSRRRATRRRAPTARRGFAFLPSNALTAVAGTAGGSIAIAMLGPRIAAQFPQLATSTLGRLMVSAAVGALGYIGLKRLNTGAATGFFVGTVVPEIVQAVRKFQQQQQAPAPAGTAGYLPDYAGVNGYLPELAAYGDGSVQYASV